MDDTTPPPLPSPRRPPRERTVPPRLPGTYTVGHERDPSPRTGRVVLVVLAVFSLLLQGGEFLFLPHANVERLVAAGLRVVAVWALVLALAAGLGWTRWLLAVVHVGLGLWLEVHAMMGSFAFAYGELFGRSPLLPTLLGAFFLGAGIWFGVSADLSAYLDRQRAGMTVQARGITAALPAVALGLPTAGLGLWGLLNPRRTEPSPAAQAPAVVPPPVPPQAREGAEFARALVERAFREKEFTVITDALSPEMKTQVQPGWTQQMSASLVRRGPPQNLELTDVRPNVSIDGARLMTFCNVFAVYADGRLCFFHFNVSKGTEQPQWQVDMVFIE